MAGFKFSGFHSDCGLLCRNPAQRDQQRRRRITRARNPQHPPTTRAHDSPAIVIPGHAEYEPAIRAHKSAPAAGIFHRLRHDPSCPVRPMDCKLWYETAPFLSPVGTLSIVAVSLYSPLGFELGHGHVSYCIHHRLKGSCHPRSIQPSYLHESH